MERSSSFSINHNPRASEVLDSDDDLWYADERRQERQNDELSMQKLSAVLGADRQDGGALGDLLRRSGNSSEEILGNLNLNEKLQEEVWLAEKVKETLADMDKYTAIREAMAACNEPRQAILISMAYQMGADGLSKFTNTLKSVATQNWHAAQAGMLASKWAKQTPNRANRHAIQMLTGVWYPDYK